MFGGTSALARGPLKTKGGGITSTHNKSDLATVELLFRTIISVNQLSVYGTVLDWCEEFCSADFRSFFFQYGETVAELNEEPESRDSPYVVSILTNPPSSNAALQGDLLRHHNKRVGNLPEDLRVSEAGEDAGFVRKISCVHFLMTIDVMELTSFGYAGSCREFTSPPDDEGSTPK